MQPRSERPNITNSGIGKGGAYSEAQENASYKSVCPDCGAIRIDKQLGLEETPEEYIDKMVAIFREVWRVMRDDGTLWLNMGDSYGSKGGDTRGDILYPGQKDKSTKEFFGDANEMNKITGLPPKNLLGMPWRLAFALQADGWYLRSDIIWSKPNPMPESCTDRPTKAHEYIFLMSKQAKYFYDADAVREKHIWADRDKRSIDGKKHPSKGKCETGIYKINGVGYHPSGRNRRTVWTIPTQPYSEAHFATFPTALVIPCMKAGTSEKGNCSVCGKPWVRVVEYDYEYGGERKAHEKYDGKSAGFGTNPGMARARARANTLGWQPSCTCNADTVKPICLDPFMGSGTVAEVCERYGRSWIGIELSQEYCDIAVKRINREAMQPQLSLD